MGKPVSTIDIAKFKPAIVYTIYIASTPEKVWQALTSAEMFRALAQALPGVKLLANMTEFGRTPYLSGPEGGQGHLDHLRPGKARDECPSV